MRNDVWSLVVNAKIWVINPLPIVYSAQIAFFYKIALHNRIVWHFLLTFVWNQLINVNLLNDNCFEVSTDCRKLRINLANKAAKLVSKILSFAVFSLYLLSCPRPPSVIRFSLLRREQFPVLISLSPCALDLLIVSNIHFLYRFTFGIWSSTATESLTLEKPMLKKIIQV